MIKILDKKIKELQELYKEKFGIKISRSEALRSGKKLVSLVEAIYKPIKK